jgi:GT2 family glycosyltransferase
MSTDSARYAVLIVNYNTAPFLAKAVESVLSCATSDDFMICVVDNASAEPDQALLRKIRHSKVRFAELDQNGGFAVGYNAAARLAEETLKPEFLVIMNPDIEIVDKGTIETLIERIRVEGNNIVGAQPFVHNCGLSWSAIEQPVIRRIPDVWDLVISESIVLRYVFRYRFKRFLMQDVKPYGRDTRFFVPSGAFFVIRTQEFFEIGGFDERTFLYGEEYILGKKLQRRNNCFLFDPSVNVLHFQGAATGFGRWKPNRRMYRFRRDSQMYYVREYMGVGQLQQFFLCAAMEFGYLVRVVAWLIRGISRLARRERGGTGQLG